MEKIAFDVKFRQQIESGEYKVVTRDGRPARIICWNELDSSYPISAAITRSDGSEFFPTFTNKGRVVADSKHDVDLFIIASEPELAESDEKIRKWLIDYFDKVNDEVVKEDRLKIIAYLENQKDASKAIEAVNRIDKYIDENTANAHDMKDSNPDKKYYCGVDDTLSNIAGILNSAYSEEKQKEQKLAESEDEKIMEELLSFLKEGYPYHCPGSIRRREWAAYLEKQRDYHKLYEDIAKSEWFKKNYVGKSLGENPYDFAMSKQETQKDQKPVHTAKEMWKEMRLEVYAHASGNRHEPNYSDDSTKMFSLCDIDEIFEKIGNSTVWSQSAEWSEEQIKGIENAIEVDLEKEIK